MRCASPLALLFLAGCAAESSEDGGSSAADVTVTPSGTPLGTLVVTLPDGVPAPNAIGAQSTASSSVPVGLRVGQPVKVPIGTYCLTMTVPLPRPLSASGGCGFVVSENQTTTVVLGGLDVRRNDPTARVLGIDLPLQTLDGSAPTLSPWTQARGVMPMFPGKFRIYPLPEVAVNAGTVTTYTLDDTTGRAALTILPPDPATRKLPDLDPAFLRLGLGNRRNDSYYSYSADLDHYASVYVTSAIGHLDGPIVYAPATGEAQGDVFMFGPREGDWGYEYRTPTGARFVVPGFAANGTNRLWSVGATTTVQLGRLEVDDVAVPMTDGTTKIVRGTFTVSTSPSDGWPLLTGPTGYGADVPPGHYEIHVQYMNPNDGSQADFRAEATVP